MTWIYGNRKNDQLYFESASEPLAGSTYAASDLGKILNYVLVESEAHSVYQKDLEREFGLRPSTVTEMLNALEQKKLIQRVSDEWDGRYKKIVFTEKARSMKDRIRQEVEETEHLLLQGITEQEKQEFLRIAGKMLQNLEAERTNEK